MPGTSELLWRRCMMRAAGVAAAATVALRDVDETGRLTPGAVHDLRVACKRLRAAWQLVRSGSDGELGERARAQDGVLRDAARGLAGNRQAHVLRKTVTRLTRRARTAAETAAFDLAMQTVCAVFPPARIQPSPDVALADLFAGQQDLFEALSTVPPPARLPAAGPHRCYRRAARLARAGIRARDPERFHAWRKWVKYELYQLEFLLLDAGGDGPWSGRRRRLTALGDELGRFHDLCDLERVVASAAFGECPPDALRRLTGRLEREHTRSMAGFVRAFARLYRAPERRYRERLQRRLRRAARQDPGQNEVRVP